MKAILWQELYDMFYCLVFDTCSNLTALQIVRLKLSSCLANIGNLDVSFSAGWQVSGILFGSDAD